MNASGGNAVANRLPLEPTPFIPLALGSVRATGWLANQLRLQADGMTGHAETVIPELGPDSAWRGGTGEDWEKGPYYLRGLVSLAYLLDDAALLAKTKSWVECIVPIMEARGPRRFVSLVGAGVAEPGDPYSFGRTIMLTLMKVLAAGVLNDASDHARIVRKSSLDWTLVRPPRLVDGPAVGNLVHAAHLKLGPSASITRADLAGFMLEISGVRTYVQQSPMVANHPRR